MKLIIKKKKDAPERSYFAHQYSYEIEDKEGNRADLTRSLQEIDLHMSVHDPGRVKLTLLPDDVEIEGEFLTDLKAFLNDQEESNTEPKKVTTAGSDIEEYAVPSVEDDPDVG